MRAKPRGLPCRLVDVVDIESLGSGQDAAGQPNGTWSVTHNNYPAHVEAISGSETGRGNEMVGVLTHKVWMRNITTVTQGMRVNVVASRQIASATVLNIEGIERTTPLFMTLLCKVANG